MKIIAKVKDQALNLVKDRRFLFKVGQKIGSLGLVGESRNGLTVFLAALTLMNPNQKRRNSVMVLGPSGSGKTALIEFPLMLLPPEFVVRRASFSRRAPAYNKESLDKKVLFVDEYRGGREAQYFLRLLQSEGQIAHEVTAGGKTEVRTRLGSPVVLTTTTEDTIFEDDMTRFLMISIDDSAEQNVAVMKAGLRENSSPEAKSEVKVWQLAVQSLFDAYKQLVFPPWFSYVAEQVSSENVRARRDWKRFLGLMQSVAMCSPDPKRNGKITIEDYCVAYSLLNSAFTASTFAINENELRVGALVKELKKKSGTSVTIKEICNRLGWNQSLAYKYVTAAVKHQIIQYEPGTREKNVKRLLPMNGSSADFLPSPNKVLDNVKELERLVEYIDPLTGEEMFWEKSQRAAEG